MNLSDSWSLPGLWISRQVLQRRWAERKCLTILLSFFRVMAFQSGVIELIGALSKNGAQAPFLAPLFDPYP
jgi:hypothetical protein